ncbi:hypothetical protein HZA97_06080 [Candidatus Woesearchaeota archaeon]|nr:hypothetical protein [Candidatus Woesearchaeota archaeon]
MTKENKQDKNIETLETLIKKLKKIGLGCWKKSETCDLYDSRDFYSDSECDETGCSSWSSNLRGNVYTLEIDCFNVRLYGGRRNYRSSSTDLYRPNKETQSGEPYYRIVLIHPKLEKPILDEKSPLLKPLYDKVNNPFLKKREEEEKRLDEIKKKRAESDKIKKELHEKRCSEDFKNFLKR